MSTIQDVAKAAQVSITTVSHVINGTRFVSDATRARVETAMDELGYRPNYLARSLRVGRTRTIGLIVPDNSNLYFAEIARIIEDLGYQNGYSVILCNTDDNIEKESSYIDVLLNKQVDGIIFISVGDSSKNPQKCIDQGIPIVVADREMPDIQADGVMLDNRAGGYLATRHLIELGHRRIACISGKSMLRPSAQRVDGYRQAMQEAGLEIPADYIVPGDFHFPSGETCMDRLLTETSQAPTAVFACNDMMAMGAMRSAHKHGLSLPRDLSIVGFDNIVLVQALFPALTTIAQPIQEMAETTVNLLIHRMQPDRRGRQQAEAYQHVVLQPTLVVRDSSQPISST